MIESELREEIKEEIIAILEDFDIFSREDFEDSIELEPDSGLIDTLMAVAEEYGLFDEDMDELLDEVLDEISAGPDREIIEKYYELAEQDRYEEAIKFIDEYIQNAGDDVSAEVLSIAGNDILMYTEDLDKGIKYFHMAMEKEPENPDIYWSYFTDLDEITDEYPETIDDAILCLTKIIEICSKIDDSDEVKGKRYDYIDEDFDKETDIARRYRDLAVIYLKILNYEKAGECINKTLMVLPDDEFANSIKDKIVEVIGEETEISEEFCESESKEEQEFYFWGTKDGFAKAIQEKSPYERKICEECGGVWITELENISVSFRGSRKGNYYKIPAHFMIDKKLKQLFEENKITGYELKDINIEGSYSFCDDGIQEMVITGRAGHLQKLTGEEFKACSTCGNIIEDLDGFIGVGFDISKWDRSDIFLIDNFEGIPVVTQKVKDLLEKNKIKNVTFTNIKEKEFV